MNIILHILGSPFQRCRNARGSTAVEIGITLLPFLLSFFGVIEFGMYYFHQHTLQSATHEGIRIGLIGATLDDDDGDALSREDSIIKAITDKAGEFLTIVPADIQINPINAVAGGPANAGTAGELMKVEVDYTHEFFSSLVGGFFADNKILIHAEGTYRNEDFIL